MKKLLMVFLMSMFGTVHAADTLIDLQTGDTVMATCLGMDCPECPPSECPPADLGFPFGHGGAHKYEAKKLKDTDCRWCHGQDLMGTAHSTTSKAASCIAIDGLVLPEGVDTVPIERYNGDILDDYEGTSIGVLPAGLPVSCGYCHEKVKYKYGGNEVEVDFKDWRKANSDDDDDSDNGKPDEPDNGGDHHCKTDIVCSDCHDDVEKMIKKCEDKD